MTRASLRSVVFLAIACLSDPSWALEASDTMAAWKDASPEQKRKVVTDILKRTAPSSVLKCLDAASGVPGHADLSIARVAKACDTNDTEPV